ncbi:nuclear-interacting partner of ALK-like [Hibiscus syriacus]|uniref:nuclear-interacting partner of ALK-like n=1 Tax=Hibiscus syriacus TaxID=106335 RepID=UPI001920B35C|nr:nuclear-interacting partner of ALK-like [Hibiscus syriacus]
MANDPKKRFHSIMDKLFHSIPSPPGTGMGIHEQLLGAKKCSNPTYSLAAEENQHGLAASESPLCRPWDRGDLLRRLSTFKSMTWFAKPKVVNFVNCAMRGWVNVDMEILACESCGTHLLFSTPPSWTQQQVENVASVFSLKLNSGHKLTCPWIDNVCDERLTEFPPTVPADLVDKFRARSNSLFQLMTLPVISSSAIEFMRNPQLEEFLRQPLMVDCLKRNAEFSQIECIKDGYVVDYANLYYHAQKLISLCGWEPCPLTYVVNFKDGQNQFVKYAETLSSPQEVDYGLNLCLNFHVADENENLETNKDSGNSFRLQYDHKYVVCVRDDNFRNVTPLEGTNVAATLLNSQYYWKHSLIKFSSNKEWKPKVINSNFGKGSRTAGAFDVPTSSVEANAHSQPVSRVLDFEEATSKLQKKLEELHLPQRRHV